MMEEMKRLWMYHGPITKGKTEEILGASGRNGSFLIRDSETVPGCYCICVLCDQYVFTYRLSQVEGKVWVAETAPGVKERRFRSVQNLLAALYQPNQGLAMPLLYPISNGKPARKRPAQHFELCDRL